jgi:FtsZ-interacting cell division protein ZipA
LQLIEIVQLALIIFIVLSVIIFFFSYLGYRTKSNIKDFPKPKIEERKEKIQELIVSNDFVESREKVEPNKSVKQNPRFEVFNPDSDDKARSESKKSLEKKSHSPKTLIIKKKS